MQLCRERNQPGLPVCGDHQNGGWGIMRAAAHLQEREEDQQQPQQDTVHKPSCPVSLFTSSTGGCTLTSHPMWVPSGGKDHGHNKPPEWWTTGWSTPECVHGLGDPVHSVGFHGTRTPWAGQGHPTLGELRPGRLHRNNTDTDREEVRAPIGEGKVGWQQEYHAERAQPTCVRGHGFSRFWGVDWQRYNVCSRHDGAGTLKKACLEHQFRDPGSRRISELEEPTVCVSCLSVTPRSEMPNV